MSLPDITETEHWSIESPLKQRWVDRTIDFSSLTVKSKYIRVLAKPLSTQPYFGRSMKPFYYSFYQQYGTDKFEYDDLANV